MSCLNLNKVFRPKIYGVKQSDFSAGFNLLKETDEFRKILEDDAVPALLTRILWIGALKMGLGDRIQFTDGEGNL